jgi:murein DD-endopeptidase MepM/ murein hydrolase activator NlpD
VHRAVVHRQAIVRRPMSAADFAHPLPTGHISSTFGPRVHPILGDLRMHTGVDIAAPRGSLVRAAMSGTVAFVGRQRGYGLTVLIQHDEAGDMLTLYGHLEAAYVRPGDRIERGEVIGSVGKTGLATGYHLHFELRERGRPTARCVDIVRLGR